MYTQQNQNRTLDAKVTDMVDRLRLDSTSAYYSNLLVTATISELFRYMYPETKWANGELIDFDMSPAAGAEAVAWNMISMTGDPGDGIVAADADQIPQADIALLPKLNRTHEVPVVIQWSDLDLDRAAMQGVYSMSLEKGAAAKKYWSEKINSLIVKGSTANNFVGVANMPGRKNKPAANTFANLSSDGILTEFQTAWDLIFGDSGAVLTPNTVVMPTTISGKMRAPTNALAVKSTLDYLKDQYPEITNWVFDPAMNDAGDGGSAAVMIYRKDPVHLRACMPLSLTPKAIQEHNMRYRMIFRSRFAGIICPQPAGICTIHGV